MSSARSAPPRERFFSARRIALAAILCGAWLVVPARAQTPEAMRVFTAPFPPEEFAARRTRVMERIDDAVAVNLANNCTDSHAWQRPHPRH